MSKPYHNVTEDWLRDHEKILSDLLFAAGQHQSGLRALCDERRDGQNSLLDFVGIDGRDVAIALSVCDKLMTGLGPTLQAMRDELQQRTAHPRRGRLPILP